MAGISDKPRAVVKRLDFLVETLSLREPPGEDTLEAWRRRLTAGMSPLDPSSPRKAHRIATRRRIEVDEGGAWNVDPPTGQGDLSLIRDENAPMRPREPPLAGEAVPVHHDRPEGEFQVREGLEEGLQVPLDGVPSLQGLLVRRVEDVGGGGIERGDLSAVAVGAVDAEVLALAFQGFSAVHQGRLTEGMSLLGRSGGGSARSSPPAG